MRCHIHTNALSPSPHQRTRRLIQGADPLHLSAVASDRRRLAHQRLRPTMHPDSSLDVAPLLDGWPQAQAA